VPQVDGARIFGDEIPADACVIQLRVRELGQLFNSIDPSPFDDKDLDAEAESFIMTWARDFPPRAKLALKIEVDVSTPFTDPAEAVAIGVHTSFARRAETASRELKALLRRGRLSLVIGIVFLTACMLLADVLTPLFHSQRLQEVIREGFTVGGWVSMWRPMEIFLYNWWPIVRERRLFERLSRMPVQVRIVRRAESPLRAA
jgi:hypothetical protein